MAPFKSGDLVVLKSGGPTMTIDTVNTAIFDDDQITGILCAWFVGDHLQRVRFDHRALKFAKTVTQTVGGRATTEVTTTHVATTETVTPEAAIADAPAVAPTPPRAKARRSRASGQTRSGSAAPQKAPAPPVAATEPVAPEPVAAEPIAETGDYAAVLDSMVGAMNAAADRTAGAPAERPAARIKPTVQVPSRKSTH